MESSETADGKVKWFSHFGKKVWQLLKMLEMSYDPAIPFLGIIAPNEKQPKCPSTDAWIKET